MFNESFKSFRDLENRFPNEQSCIDYLEARRWRGNIVSPYDSNSKVTKSKNNNYWCSSARRYFNVKTGTIFENTKIPLRDWFYAIYMVTSHKKGISSHQLGRDIGITQKSAWFLIQRIHTCLGIKNADCLQNEVECDETYVGGKAKNKHANKRQKGTRGRSTKDKTPVFGIIERDGRVVAKVVEDTTQTTLVPIIQKAVNEDVIIYTDEWKAYINLGKLYQHEVVKHKNGEYVNGRASTNGIENYWSHLKRMILGIHHWVSPKRLQVYVNGQSFRHNTRNNTTSERFALTLQNSNQRLKYKDLVRNEQ